MGAISLHRGNLHRVPDVPRRWLMPTPQISLKDFKSLLHRRSRAFTCRCSATAISNHFSEPQEEATPEDIRKSDTGSVPESEHPSQIRVPHRADDALGDAEDQGKSDGAGCSEIHVHDESVPGPGLKPVVGDTAADPTDGQRNSQALTVKPNSETKQASNIMGSLTDKEKRKNEVEEKLQVLNEKKHNLVQVLKQILNAEEELKGRSSNQAIAGPPPIPLQVDVGNDSGLVNRQVAPRMGLEGNLGGDIGGGEADDTSNHIMHAQQLLRISSISPSSESPHRKPAFLQHNVVPHPARANLGATSSPSPSRFAPIGHQSHPSNLPTVSVSGTSYIASSPPPAASGGTSSFREARLRSPWN